MSTSKQEFDQIWTALLSWLSTFEGFNDVEKHVALVHNSAGRGLVARNDLPPSTQLISIPNQALLNLYTLSPLYPSPFTSGQLNATQLVSLHLALQFHKHLSCGDVTDQGKRKGKESISSLSAAAKARDKWWPFLASLPRSFRSHPLTWHILSLSPSQLASTYSVAEDELRNRLPETSNAKAREDYRRLKDCFGPGLRSKTEAVQERFNKDWNEVQRVWTSNKSTMDPREDFTFYDFLLGWLNVNTRCIYFDLPSTSSSPSHWSKKENSLTLCPIIDMINHLPSLSTKPHPTPTALTFSSPSRSSPDRKVSQGDELAFSYGGHDDSFLLSEYGFIMGSNSNEYDSLNVDKYVEALFESQASEGEFKIGILKDSDYWGDMTFQSHPPSPSWRVLTALRLFHLRLPLSSSSSSSSSSTTMTTTTTLTSDALLPFYDLLTGTIDQVSHLNEKKVEASLKAIAKTLVDESRTGIERCERLESDWGKEDSSERKRIQEETAKEEEEEEEEEKEVLTWLKMVKEVWIGQETIAKAIAEG